VIEVAEILGAVLGAWALFCFGLGCYLEATGSNKDIGGFVVVVFCIPFVALWDWVTGE
jgi:hypothetical protein